MSQTTYRVNGMTCEHCVEAVQREVGAIDGVSDVSVQLVAEGTSTVVVTSDGEVDGSAVAAAVDEAGYELTDHEDLGNDIPPS